MLFLLKVSAVIEPSGAAIVLGVIVVEFALNQASSSNLSLYCSRFVFAKSAPAIVTGKLLTGIAQAMAII